MKAEREEHRSVPIEIKDCLPAEAVEKGRNSSQRGRLDDFDGHAVLTGKCGETIEIFLKFKGERVSDASFLTDGCRSITACGSHATEMALGKSPDEILEITGDAIMKRLGDFPREEAHCALLAAETLQEALHSYMVKREAKGNFVGGGSGPAKKRTKG